MDDAVETFFMNIVFRNRLSSLPYSLSMFGGEFEIIRPLLEIREKNILQYAKIKEFMEQRVRCPYENKSNRYKIKKMIEENEKFYPGYTEKVFYSMHTVDKDYLPDGENH
jgi:tRNA 2-thiocytidine biosynthesis protein TtcA